MTYIDHERLLQVYVKESSLEKQVFIGSFLGPFLALLTLAIVLFNYSPHQMELPLTALVGLYCSWKWGIRGSVVACVLLAAVASFKIVSSPDASAWWNISFASSIGLACLITALTQRNVRDHLEWKYQDFIEQQSRLAIVEGRLNTILQTVGQERAQAEAAIEALRAQLDDKIAGQEHYAAYMETSRQELCQTRAANESLHRDLVEMHQRVLISKELLEGSQEALRHLEGREEVFNRQEAELKGLRHTLGAFEHQIASYKDDLQRSQQQQPLIHEMGELIDTLTREKKLLESTLTALQTELEELRLQPISDEVRVDEDSPGELRRLEGFYRQLRLQFEEKTQILEETRRQLFQTQERLNAIQLDFSERELISPQISLQEHSDHLARAESEFNKELAVSQQEIHKLYDLIESIMKK